MRGERALHFITETIWCILPAKLEQIIAIVEARLSGEVLTDAEIQARIAGAPPKPEARRAGAIAVIPVHGMLAHHADMMTQMSGGTSPSAITTALREAVADPAVTAVVLHVHSPGGSVLGIEEAAAEIYNARGTKPIIALCDAQCASAAFWLASQADEILMVPSGEIGAVGAIGVHTDVSEAAKKEGVQKTFITSGKYKAEGNPYSPLSDEARAHMQDRVDAYGETFVKSVARGRGVSQASVRDGYGQGRMYGAAQAMNLGMVDGVATFDQVVARLASGRKRVASARAEDETPPIAAVDPSLFIENGMMVFTADAAQAVDLLTDAPAVLEAPDEPDAVAQAEPIQVLPTALERRRRRLRLAEAERR